MTTSRETIISMAQKQDWSIVYDREFIRIHHVIDRFGSTVTISLTIWFMTDGRVKSVHWDAQPQKIEGGMRTLVPILSDPARVFTAPRHIRGGK
jgi:hypothetical protein